jgi:hypothetical protein
MKVLRKDGTSTLAQQFEHRSIELVSAKLFRIGISTAAIEHPKRAAKVPQRPTPAGFFPKRKTILHPIEDHPVRRLIVCAKFTHYHAHAPRLQLFPRLNGALAHRFLIPVHGPVFQWIFRFRPTTALADP